MPAFPSLPPQDPLPGQPGKARVAGIAFLACYARVAPNAGIALNFSLARIASICDLATRRYIRVQSASQGGGAGERVINDSHEELGYADDRDSEP
jgi:hypothetical protein